MRVGHHAYQHHRRPAAATVGEKVGLTNGAAQGRRPRPRRLGRPPAQDETPGRLAAHLPRWIAQAYVDLLGDEAEEALSANNVPPVPTLVVRPGLAEVSELDGNRPAAPRSAPAPWQPGDHPPSARPPASGQGSRSWARWPGSNAQSVARPSVPPGGRPCSPAWRCSRGARCWPPSSSRTAPSWSRPCAPTTASCAAIAADGTGPWAPGLRWYGRRPAPGWGPCAGVRNAVARTPDTSPTRAPAAPPHLGLDSAAPGGVVAYVTCSPHRNETEGVLRGDEDDVTRESTTQLYRTATGPTRCCAARRRA